MNSPSKVKEIHHQGSAEKLQTAIDIPTVKNSKNKSQKTQKIDNLCPICLDEYAPSHIVVMPVCHHDFCSECLKEYLNTRISTSKVLNITCPQSGCTAMLDDKVIRKALDPSQYLKYHSIVLTKQAHRDPKHRFCPKPGCSRQLKASDNRPYTVCRCGAQVCNTCNNFWHEGKSCLEAIDPEFEVFSKDNDLRFCSLCKMPGRREAGCNTIICPVCDFSWCYVCGRERTLFHNCVGYWSPAPPTLRSTYSPGAIEILWKKSSTQEKICFVITKILTAPFVLIKFLLLWPLYDIFNPQTDLSRKKPFKSALVILFSLLLAIMYLPATVFLFVICFSIFLLIRFIFSFCFKSSQNKPIRRWILRDTTARNRREDPTVHPSSSSIPGGRQINKSQHPENKDSRELAGEHINKPAEGIIV